MDRKKIEEQIRKGAENAGKHYSFNDDHDSSKPADFWFQQDDTGLVLFIVFYTQACRWSRCLGCNLPARMSSRHVPFHAIMKQVDFLFAHPDIQARLPEIRKVIVSNNGSVLDEATFSSTALIYLLAKLNLHMPNLHILSLETRPEYTDFAELEFLSRALAESDTPTRLELAIGFEAFDDRIRNDVFNKGLSLEMFEKFVRTVTPYQYRLKTYFMQKPVPGMTDDEAVLDVQRGIDYLNAIADAYRVDINMHLNPTYAARGTRLEDSFRKGEYRPPFLKDVARAAAHGRGKAVSIFIGLSDEGLAIEGGSFIRVGEETLIQRMEAFNRTQEYDILDRIMTEGS